MRENRLHKRIDCELPAQWAVHESGRERISAETTVDDLSEGGVRFRAGRFLPVGSLLSFRLALPRRRAVEATVKPEWVVELPHLNQYEIGASFLSLSGEDVAAIRDFMETSPETL